MRADWRGQREKSAMKRPEEWTWKSVGSGLEWREKQKEREREEESCTKNKSPK